MGSTLICPHSKSDRLMSIKSPPHSCESSVTSEQEDVYDASGIDELPFDEYKRTVLEYGTGAVHHHWHGYDEEMERWREIYDIQGMSEEISNKSRVSSLLE